MISLTIMLAFLLVMHAYARHLFRKASAELRGGIKRTILGGGAHSH